MRSAEHLDRHGRANVSSRVPLDDRRSVQGELAGQRAQSVCGHLGEGSDGEGGESSHGGGNGGELRAGGGEFREAGEVLDDGNVSGEQEGMGRSLTGGGVVDVHRINADQSDSAIDQRLGAGFGEVRCTGSP